MFDIIQARLFFLLFAGMRTLMMKWNWKATFIMQREAMLDKNLVENYIENNRKKLQKKERTRRVGQQNASLLYPGKSKNWKKLQISRYRKAVDEMNTCFVCCDKTLFSSILYCISNIYLIYHIFICRLNIQNRENCRV